MSGDVNVGGGPLIQLRQNGIVFAQEGCLMSNVEHRMAVVLSDEPCQLPLR
jgi:hypothetical protein